MVLTVVRAEKGAKFTKGGLKYKINSDIKNVTVTGPTSKEVAEVNIPATVRVGGVSYKVVYIGKNAFNGCDVLRSVVIGKNVKQIATKAFYQATSLREIIIKSKQLKKVSADAFEGVYPNAKFTVPEGYIDQYIDKYLFVANGITKQTVVNDRTIETWEMAADIYNDEMVVKADDTQQEKIRKVHDWLVINTSYGKKQFMDYLENEYSYQEMANIVINEHYGICSGYADAFKLFMDLAGIDCITISSAAMDHAWNMVRMDDGHWYHVDVTWDDPGSNNDEWEIGWLGNKNMLRNDEGIKETGHYEWQKDAPKADGTYYETSIGRYLIQLNSKPDCYEKGTSFSGTQLAKMRKLQVNDTLFFGSYEQDNDTTNGKESIEWVVLDKKDGQLMLISKYALGGAAYSDYNPDNLPESVTWEDSELRSMLNSYFYNYAFSEKEKEYIAKTNVKNEDNPTHGTEGGNDTMDYVFLLSITEACDYFASDVDRRAAGTKSAIAELEKGAWIYTEEKYGWHRTKEYDGNAWWWLRSPGDEESKGTFVSYKGEVDMAGIAGYYYSASIRPVIWLDLN